MSKLDPGANGEAVSGPAYTLTRLSGVEPRPLSWLWKHRIPLGMVTLVAGDGGKGKSTVMLDIASRLTTGDEMPDGTPGDEPASVIVFSSEDNTASVVVPRLILAGADMDKVATFKLPTREGDDRELVIEPKDLALLERAVLEIGAKLVIFDPVVAYVDADANLHHNQDARRVLARLHGLAEGLGIAVVGIHHFNRGQHQDAVHRLTGSAGIANASRSVLVAGPDPGDNTGERMVLALAKHNLAPRTTPSLAYRLEVPDQGEHPRVEWLGESAVNANDMVAVPTDPEERTLLDEAAELLRERCQHGPVAMRELESEARARGISGATLGRAKRREGLKALRLGGAAGAGWWAWALPTYHHSDALSENPLPQADMPKSIMGGGSVGRVAIQAKTGQRMYDARIGQFREPSNDWYTPSEIVEAARRVLGSIDLDPASCEAAQEVVQAGNYFTQETDGLAQEWQGRVWLNPPYEARLARSFTAKLIEELAAGRVTAAAVLCSSRTGTDWGQALKSRAAAWCEFRARIYFWHPSRRAGASPHDSVAFYFGSNVAAFQREFGSWGLVTVPAATVAEGLARDWEPAVPQRPGFGAPPPACGLCGRNMKRRSPADPWYCGCEGDLS